VQCPQFVGGLEERGIGDIGARGELPTYRLVICRTCIAYRPGRRCGPVARPLWVEMRVVLQGFVVVDYAFGVDLSVVL